jgi:hypothetical protein
MLVNQKNIRPLRAPGTKSAMFGKWMNNLKYRVITGIKGYINLVKFLTGLYTACINEEKEDKASE